MSLFRPSSGLELDNNFRLNIAQVAKVFKKHFSQHKAKLFKFMHSSADLSQYSRLIEERRDVSKYLLVLPVVTLPVLTLLLKCL